MECLRGIKEVRDGSDLREGSELFGSRPAGGRAGAAPASDNGASERFSAKRKADVVVRMIRGEDLDTLSRELRVAVPDLAAWRDAFLGGGQQALRSRQGDPLERQLKEALAKVGEMTMRIELYEAAKKRGPDPASGTYEP